MRFFTALLTLSIAAVSIDARMTHKRDGRLHSSRFSKRASNFTLSDMYKGQSFFECVSFFFIINSPVLVFCIELNLLTFFLLSGFNFFTDADPTHGQVEFVSQDEASGSNLAFVQGDGTVIMAVDNSTDLAEGENRKSVRISSKKTYSTGLIIADIYAMPHGCGTWPAFW
jgi:hypothetical protein